MNFSLLLDLYFGKIFKNTYKTSYKIISKFKYFLCQIESMTVKEKKADGFDPTLNIRH